MNRQKLEKVFTCLFCNHDNSCTVKLDFDNEVGSLSCSSCPVSYQTKINALSEPIDVYSQWVDAVEEANEGKRDEPDEDEEYDDQ